MKDLASGTAILLFARSSAAETHHKWLPKGKEIYDSLNDRAIALISASGIPFFHITEEDQVGDGFGARFSHAVDQIFQLGYTSLISIGNDTPHLTQNDIQNAYAEIQSGNVVIGPSKDGGIYLLGIHKSSFRKSEFETLSWCTSELRHELEKHFLTYENTLHFLPVYIDLDSNENIKEILQFSKIIPISILKLLRYIFTIVQDGFEFLKTPLQNPIWTAHLNKGSPS